MMRVVTSQRTMVRSSVFSYNNNALMLIFGHGVLLCHTKVPKLLKTP